MSRPNESRALRTTENLLCLAAAAMLAAWSLAGRPVAWQPVLWAAVVVLGLVCVRRLAGWIRAK